MHRPASTSLLLTLAAACGLPGGDDATGAAATTSTTAATDSDGSPTAGTDAATAATPTGTGTAGQTAETGTTEPPDDTGATTEQGPPEFDAAWCTKLDPRDVYLAGTYEQGAAYLSALIHPTDARTSCPGFVFDPHELWIRPGDGRVVWLELFANDAIRVMTPDPPAWADGMWIYPPDPHANDELIPTPACMQVDQFNDWWGPRELLLHPDGTIVYTCVSDLPQRIYYDQTGAPRFTTKDDRVIAVASDWSLLTVQLAGTAATLRFVPPGGPALAIAGPDPAALVFATRAEGGGFRVALIPPDDGPIERWLITGPELQDNTLEGSFAPTMYGNPPFAGDGAARLTRDGSLVYIREIETTVDVIIRAPLAPGTATVLYTEELAPGKSWPTDPHPFVYLHVSRLFTGP